jgi:hypothetical protein
MLRVQQWGRTRNRTLFTSYSTNHTIARTLSRASREEKSITSQAVLAKIDQPIGSRECLFLGNKD